MLILNSFIHITIFRFKNNHLKNIFRNNQNIFSLIFNFNLINFYKFSLFYYGKKKIQTLVEVTMNSLCVQFYEKKVMHPILYNKQADHLISFKIVD